MEKPLSIVGLDGNRVMDVLVRNSAFAAYLVLALCRDVMASSGGWRSTHGDPNMQRIAVQHASMCHARPFVIEMEQREDAATVGVGIGMQGLFG